MSYNPIGNKLTKTTFGQFWYGKNLGFPGFIYKSPGSKGGRRSTQFTPGGTAVCNGPQYIYNKYKPGNNGIGANSIANRRAKNRKATICGTNTRCFPCYTQLGQYSSYTHNQKGYYQCT